MNDLDPMAVALAPALSRFGLDATDLDMLKRGDMLGSIGGKVFDALRHLSATIPAGDGELVERLEAQAVAIGEYRSSRTVTASLLLEAASRLSQAGVRVTDEMVATAMREAWDDICSDTGCHPDDIQQVGRKRLEFSPLHWARFTAQRIRSALSLNPTGGADR